MGLDADDSLRPAARVPDAASIVHFSKETRKLEQPLDKLPRQAAPSAPYAVPIR